MAKRGVIVSESGRAKGESRRANAGKSATRRGQILDEALAAFASAGYRAASTKLIAERAGISESGVFYHFPTKSALLQAVLERRDELAQESILADLEDGVEKLRGLLALAEHNSRSPGVIELYTVLSGEATAPDHPARQYFTDRYERLRTEISETFKRLQREGLLVEAVSPEDVAAGNMALWDGLQLQSLLDPGSVDIARELAHYFEQVTTVSFDVDGPEA